MITCEFILFDLNMTRVLKHDGKLPVLKTDPFHIAQVPTLEGELKMLPLFISGCVKRTENNRVYFGYVKNAAPGPSFNWEAIEYEPAAKKMKQVISDSNLPWFHPEWLETFAESLQPYVNSGSLSQVRVWDRCALFKTEELFIKAVPDVFAHEPGVTNWLSDKFPDYVPEIADVASSGEQLVMKNMTGTLLGYSDDFSHWLTAGVQLAEIQREALDHMTDLRKLGCPVREINDTLRHADAVFTQLAEEGFTLPSGLMQHLTDIQKRSASLRLPLSLDHGDFFGGNCMNDNGRIRIFDWSDCSITHPFLSIAVFLEEVSEVFGAATVKEVQKAYLSKWLDHGTMSELAEELSVIQKIEPIFYLVVYETFIFPNCFFKWDRKDIIQSYLDKIEGCISRGE